MSWTLITEAGPEVGLGHLSRTCGLAQAFSDIGEDVLLVVTEWSLAHLVDLVGAETARRRWLEALPYTARPRSDVSDAVGPYENVVVDLRDVTYRFPESSIYGVRAAFCDYGDPHGHANVVISPHDHRFEIGGKHQMILSGSQFQPLRREYWENRNERRSGVWVDDRLKPSPIRASMAAKHLGVAQLAYTYVGVTMYEAIARLVPTIVVARDGRERRLAEALPVKILSGGNIPAGVQEIAEPDGLFETGSRVRRGAIRLAETLQRVSRITFT